MSETITIEIDTMAKKLLKKDGKPRQDAEDADLESLQKMRDENPDVKLWFEETAPAAEPKDELTAEQGWIRFWNANPAARELTTELGKPRTNLSKTNFDRAKELLKESGL